MTYWHYMVKKMYICLMIMYQNIFSSDTISFHATVYKECITRVLELRVLYTARQIIINQYSTWWYLFLAVLRYRFFHYYIWIQRHMKINKFRLYNNSEKFLTAYVFCYAVNSDYLISNKYSEILLQGWSWLACGRDWPFY